MGKAIDRLAKPKKGTPRASEACGRKRRWAEHALSPEEIVASKRLALVKAAGKAFREKGFHNTSLDEVAAALNVTKPTLYYYVSGKQDLLYRCHDYALDLGDEALKFGLEGTDGLDKLRRMLTRYITLLTDTFSSYSVLSDLGDLASHHRAAIQARRRKFDGVFRGFIKAGIADGSIRHCDTKMAVFWFMGAINAIPRWFEPGRGYTGAEVADIYLDFIAHGLAKSR